MGFFLIPDDVTGFHVLCFIKDSDYAQLVDRARATRALDFQKLKEFGLIERKGKGKATYYILKDN